MDFRIRHFGSLDELLDAAADELKQGGDVKRAAVWAEMAKALAVSFVADQLHDMRIETKEV